MSKSIRFPILMFMLLSLVTGCTAEINTNALPAAATPSPTASFTSPFTVEGTVQDVSHSARVIFLSEPVKGVETIATTDETQITNRQGNLLALQQIQPRQPIQATGEKHQNFLRATQVIVNDNSPVDEPANENAETPEAKPTEWQGYSSSALGISFRYPTNWQVSEEGSVVYVYSDKVTDVGAKYYIYLEEYPAPQMQTLEQAIENRWGVELAQNLQIVETTMGEKTVYETSDIPSADGALTLFVEGGGRYIAISLTPYDRETQTPVQRECEQVLRNLVSGITLGK